MNADLLFVGLPATGKTTYLALLYRAIVTDKAGCLGLGSYKDDREYVNRIAEVLASCTEADHTEVDQQEMLALSLKSASQDFFLTIPDMSGETWEHTLSDRGWTTEMDGRVREATGFALFVHAGHVDVQPTISEMHAAMISLAGDVDENLNEDSTETEIVDGAPVDEVGAEDGAVIEDPVRGRATQVSIVDLLQILSSRHALSLRVSLILSAWDLVPDGETPSGWVSENLPLVHQFIETNTSWLKLRIWGVSAQGGDFDNPERREVLLPQDAVDRSLICAADGQACAVEDPVVWALGLQ